MKRLQSIFVLTAAFGAFACSDSATTEGPQIIETTDGGADAEPQAAFELAVAADKLPILQGTSETLEVTLTRKAGFTGEVTLSEPGLPPGVSVNAVTFRANETKATLTFTASDSAHHSLPTVVSITGKSGAMEATKPVTVTVYGPPGSLDQSFGTEGTAILPVGAGDDYGYAMAVQPDGKIVVVGRAAEDLGDFAVIRLERDGTPDTSFGDGGKVVTSVGDGADTAYAVAVQPDGMIVVGGTSVSDGTGSDFALVRYRANGQIDPGFGNAGRVVTSFANDADTLYALLVTPDGKILAAGDSNQGTTGVDFALARYLSDGSLDPAFGAGGKTVTAIHANTGRDSAYALTLQTVGADTFILAAGGEGDFELARYTSAGVLDTTFATQGKIGNPFGSVIGAARGVKVDAAGKIVVAGHSNHDFAAIRLSATGELDPSFGTGGKVITPVSATNWDEATALAIDADGNIVLGGFCYEGGSSSGNFTMVRYTPAGALDPTFDTDGIVSTQVAPAGKADEAHAISLQADERVPTVRVLLAGYGNTSGANDVAVTRYWR